MSWTWPRGGPPPPGGGGRAPPPPRGRPPHPGGRGLRDAIGLVSQNTGVLPLEGVPDFGASVNAAATASD